MGAGRRVRICFKGHQFSEDYLAPRTGKTRKTEDDADSKPEHPGQHHADGGAQPAAGGKQHDQDAERNDALYEALLGSGRLSLLIEVVGRTDAERTDGLIVELDYGAPLQQGRQSAVRDGAAA
jgi:hypothetical protein